MALDNPVLGPGGMGEIGTGHGRLEQFGSSRPIVAQCRLTGAANPRSHCQRASRVQQLVAEVLSASRRAEHFVEELAPDDPARDFNVGLLMVDPEYGTAAQNEDGIHQLIWPLGSTARRLAGGEVAVLNRNGAVVATTGRNTSFGHPIRAEAGGRSKRATV